MNQIRYVNFQALYSLGVNGNNVTRKNSNRSVFAGMWPLTVLTKEGFAGLKRLQEEEEDYSLAEIRKVVSKTLQQSPIRNPREEEYLDKLRNYVHQEVGSVFRH